MKRAYPWEKWFKKKRLVLRQGKDFEVESYVFAQQVRNRASLQKLRVALKVEKDSVHVSVLGKRR